jgi:hypothetical protein
MQRPRLCGPAQRTPSSAHTSVRVDADVEQQLLWSAGRGSEGDPAHKPGAHLCACVLAQFPDEWLIEGDHTLLDALAHHVGEVLGDAAGRSASKAQNMLRRDVELAVAPECQAEAAPLG